MQISFTSINYIQAQHQKVNIYDREQPGSLSMTTPRDITSTSTPKENKTVPLEKQKTTLVPDNYLSGNLFNHKIDRMQYPLNDTDDESEKDSILLSSYFLTLLISFISQS